MIRNSNPTYKYTIKHMVKPTMDSPCNNIESSCDSSSKMYKGVRKRKWGKWVSEIRLPNSRERIWLGSYDTQEKAARAFDAALYCLRGKTATFNFPDTPHNLETNVVVLPRQSLSPQQIQEVAANFANIHPPTDTASQEQEPSSNSPSESKSNNTLDTVQVDQGDLFDPTDWTFYNTFDDDFNDLYFGPGEFLCSAQPSMLFQGTYQDEIEREDDHDAFSNHSYLWSWNF